MYSTVDRVDFDSGNHVEPRLFKAERQPSGTSEEIDTDRTIILLR